MQSRHNDRFQYFQEQNNTSKDYYVSYVSPFVTLSSGTNVLEIGCGEGGNLLPFAALGCSVTGIDKDSERIGQAIKFFRHSGEEGKFLCADFLACPRPMDAYKSSAAALSTISVHVRYGLWHLPCRLCRYEVADAKDIASAKRGAGLKAQK